MRTIGLDMITRGTTQRRRREETDEHFLKRLTHVNLSDRKIAHIEGLEGCANLTALYLHENRISRIECLDFAINLTHLYLQDNAIESMENLEPLENLRKLFIGGNALREVTGLEGCRQLQELHVQAQRNPEGEPLHFDPRTLDAISMSLMVLNVQKNSIWQASQFAQCQALERLDLSMNKGACMQINILEMKGNPVDRQHKFRDYVTLMSPTLTVLNGKEITQTERRFLVNREAAKARSRKFEQNPAGQQQEPEFDGISGVLLMEPGDSDPIGDRRANRGHINEVPRKGGGEQAEREVYTGGQADARDREAEKEMLQNHMQFEGDVPQVAPREAGGRGGDQMPSDQERFQEVAGEIQEREEYLAGMHDAGRKDHDALINAQISEKVMELEQLDERINAPPQ
ncbi:hypothetical protein T484DRAFT_1910334 [Baffinella frigidus]|nr:hypothetical protein T484DRAFT_1910334 [Cryptophyta sp. CCMP2293]